MGLLRLHIGTPTEDSMTSRDMGSATRVCVRVCVCVYVRVHVCVCVCVCARARSSQSVAPGSYNAIVTANGVTPQMGSGGQRATAACSCTS